jgi:hypothetical protein
MDEIRPTDGVAVTLGKREFTLRYDIGAMKEAKAEFGGSITSPRVLAGIDEDKIGKLLWYGLRANHPEITVEEIDLLVDPTQMKDIMRSYAKAVNIAFAEPKNEPSPAEALEAMEKLQTLLARAETVLTSMKSISSESGRLQDTTLVSIPASSGV